MATIFSRIIAGELPGRFVWRDDQCVAFLSINPITPGHTLVVPRHEVDHWLDLDETELEHLHVVGQRIGRAIHAAFGHARVGSVYAGFDVPHVHLHVIGADSMADLDFANAAVDPDPAVLDDAMQRIRAGLRERGHGDAVPSD